jgi:flagellar biosynthesis protein FlhF
MPNAEKSGNLYVKSFFAASVPAAMEQARRELGADALLLNSRPAPPEARHLGEYEVVFGTLPEGPAPAPPPPPRLSRADDLHHRIHEIREMIGRMRPSFPLLSSEESGVAGALIDAGVDVELAQSIERAVRRRVTKPAVLDIARPQAAATPELQSATVDELVSRFEVQPEIGRITALVGPAGSGKTTTLVKLAVTQCLKLGRPVRLISADNLRIGGADQLRTYASILGVPFQAVEGTVALAQAVDSAPANTWLLIDTPGFSAALLEDLGGGLVAFLSRRQDIDTHLVLTASTDRADRAKVAGRFAAFRAGKLIFTHLDETTTTAAVFCEAARTRKPLSFLCHGQSVPEDIVAASKNLVIDSLVRQLPVSLQAVA